MKKVDVGDILRIKKEEKPDAAFWTQFERELEQKRLIALVKGPSWSVRLAQNLTKILSPVLPVAGVAALTLMVFTADSRDSQIQTSDTILAEYTSEMPVAGGLEENGGQPMDFLASKVGAKSKYVNGAISLADGLGGSADRVLSTKVLSVGVKKGVNFAGSDLSRTGLVVASASGTRY